MTYCCYILYSSILDLFYVGETKDVEDRVKLHNESFFENSFTSRASDWELYYYIPCESRKQAREIESHIKKMKSRKYINDLKMYPAIAKRLKEKYS